MKKLHELLAKKPLKGDVGIEIECEGKGFLEINNEVWKSEDDNSLRGRYPDSRVEYVLKKPIPVNTVESAVKELNVAIPGAVHSHSFRTSVHVHVNILDLNEDQLLSFLYTYYLLEDPLFHFCGKDRRGNRFCLRLQDADGISVLLNQLFKLGARAVNGFIEDSVRYSACNLAAIKKYGSVEFRGMNGTLDSERINIWANTLVSLRNFSCHFKNCLEVHDLYVTKGPEEFLKFVLGDLSKHFLYKGCVKDIQRGYSLSLDLPYIYKNRITTEDEEKADTVPVAPGVRPYPGDWLEAAGIVGLQLPDNVAVVAGGGGMAQIKPRVRKVIRPVAIHDDYPDEP